MIPNIAVVLIVYLLSIRTRIKTAAEHDVNRDFLHCLSFIH